MSANESMTQGVIKALLNGRNRTICKDCGFPLPVYPGRYPSKCPNCEAPRSPEADEQDEE